MAHDSQIFRAKANHKLIQINKKDKYIEDIYFFEVNTKYISSSVLKTLEFLRVRSTSENSDVLTHEMKYIIWYLPKKNFFLYFILCVGYITEKGGAENAITNFFSKPK